MREYLMSVIGAALIAGIVSIAVPTGSGEGLRRYVGLVGALCVLCVLLTPVSGLLGLMADIADGSYGKWFEVEEEGYRERYSDFMLSVGKENIEEGIVALLYERFGIPESECTVLAEVSESGGELVIAGVTVTLTGKSVMKDPYAIEKYISELLDCECRVR